MGRRVIVVGTGAAGLATAVAARDEGAEVVLLERAELIGGTSAVSGGVVWVVGNAEAREAGVEDGVELALEYLSSLAHGTADLDLARVWFERGPELVDWLAASTPIQLKLVPGLPDKHPEHPGGLTEGGRAMEPTPFPFSELGEWADRVARSGLPSHLMLTEIPAGGGDGAIDEAEMASRVERDVRSLGQALVGGLLKACLDRGVEPRLSTRALAVARDGDQLRLTVESDGRTEELEADAVVLASGGFESNPALVEAFLRGPIVGSAGVDTNFGEGLMIAMSQGAKLGNMAEAWWAPVVLVPNDEGGESVELTQRERTVPGSIMVNRRGRRFCNEATNYNSLGGAFHQIDPRSFDFVNEPAWIVFDDACLSRYGFLGAPAQATVAQAEAAVDGRRWLARGDSLRELAAGIGVDADALEATVQRFNAAAAKGVDPEFGRGESAYERFNGDHSRPGALATLGPLDQPPFYAARVGIGVLGTKGGPRTSSNGQVLDLNDAPIPGLYAVGNAMAGISGMAYTGAGGTLGPALTFGMLAGRHAATAPG
ncbi:MAG: FAD-dependent oxidoreductase [Solirubrobacterales bacterium]